MIYGELGLFPIEIDVKLRMISYLARLLTGKETKLSYLSYNILHNLFIDENLDFSWIKHAKHIFDDTGYCYIWSQQFFQNSDLLLALICLVKIVANASLNMKKMSGNKHECFTIYY
jgi:hypothetical protein